MELIDKAKLIHVLNERQKYESDLGYCQGLMFAIDATRQMKEIDAEPVKRGRWIYAWGGDYPNCSCCERSDKNAGTYCGNCGAKMDAETE